ncbi:hypothetical protein GLYMA_07G130250v4 [Glycine max]|nr:hypothetical protein GLYMA_07G130250v4 [Glycine max]KAH1086651.1 hypothetical protein GYH30_018251 [Glycine max]
MGFIMFAFNLVTCLLPFHFEPSINLIIKQKC